MQAAPFFSEDEQRIRQTEKRPNERHGTCQPGHEHAQQEDPAQTGAAAVGAHDLDAQNLLAEGLPRVD